MAMGGVKPLVQEKQPRTFVKWPATRLRSLMTWPSGLSSNLQALQTAQSRKPGLMLPCKLAPSAVPTWWPNPACI
ncbi:hypothetical protein DUNSADRAFT_4128 [Dunaliella salina]|uniref:Uncharacterized protein n=1 Tax=Dunaliella salina TaxID=3046 RepID=A0ABQ7GSN3_DUNSA|nr:hypothetical protein DUNSADRAFT_4128 [Dunaliella salina]|eukprot:KAF5837625.1 hypothetical protein DUNSADRAFT_4128 [Dunaliella salina]